MRRFFVVRDRELVRGGLERVFALSTSVPVVQRTLGFRPVAGVTRGRVTSGSAVLWRGWRFGLPQRHLTRITEFAAPHFEAGGARVAWFQDTQEAGRFAFFRHDHHMLDAGGGQTLLQDEIRFALPMGRAGALVGRWVLLPYMRRILRARMQMLGRLAGSAEGDRYV